MIDKQYLLGKLALLKSQFEQLKADMNATQGGMQLIQHLMAELEKFEAEAKQSAKRVKEELPKL